MNKLMRISGLLAGIGLLTSCSDIRIKEHKEWKQYFDEYGVEGCFEVYDNNKETAHYYNKERSALRVSPASTFKIFNSLVALEDGVAADEQLVIQWDGVTRSIANWNQDLTMAQAFRYSSVPYYQELARRNGRERMQHYLDTVRYGNARIGPEIDQFWLNDTLLISADEQVGFIKRLYHAELPFSARSQRIVRGMMLQKDEPGYKLYYKTGWGDYKGEQLLWVVGYVEKFNELKNVKTKKLEVIPHPYFFAMNFSTADTTRDLQEIRVALLQKLLHAQGIGE